MCSVNFLNFLKLFRPLKFILFSKFTAYLDIRLFLFPVFGFQGTIKDYIIL